MGKLIFVSLMGIGGVYVGIRYARWHNYHKGKGKRNRSAEWDDEMGVDSNVDE